jgi:CheY-like chemotaxis protein
VSGDEVLAPRVLVVEDDPDHRRALTLTLHLGGYTTSECGSGEDALEKLGPNLAKPSDIDGVVLDIRLPGIDGVEVLTQMRAQMTTRCVPVVLISAHASTPIAVQRDEYARFVPSRSTPTSCSYSSRNCFLPLRGTPDERDDH